VPVCFRCPPKPSPPLRVSSVICNGEAQSTRVACVEAVLLNVPSRRPSVDKVPPGAWNLAWDLPRGPIRHSSLLGLVWMLLFRGRQLYLSVCAAPGGEDVLTVFDLGRSPLIHPSVVDGRLGDRSAWPYRYRKPEVPSNGMAGGGGGEPPVMLRGGRRPFRPKPAVTSQVHAAGHWSPEES
jgi:hypothetical protein